MSLAREKGKKMGWMLKNHSFWKIFYENVLAFPTKSVLLCKFW